MDCALQPHGSNQPEPRPAQPSPDPRARRRPHLHHGDGRRRAPRFQHADEGKDASRRLRGADDPDGDGHLQRPHTNQLDREPDALALSRRRGSFRPAFRGGGPRLTWPVRGPTFNGSVAGCHPHQITAETAISPSKEPPMSSGKVERSTDDAAALTGGEGATPASLDKVRDILFGSQMRDVERRFARLEERLLKETTDLKDDVRRRL